MQALKTFIMNHQVLSMAFVVAFFLVFLVEFIRSRRAIYFASPAEAINLINHKNAVVIDMRSTEHYRSGHIINALSTPETELRKKPEQLTKFKNKPILLVCETGAASKKLATLLLNQNYDVYAVRGGLMAWRQANMPLVKG